MKEQVHLPPPHQFMWTEWKIDEIREAHNKSRAALLELRTSPQSHLNLTSISTSTRIENLFVVDTTKFEEAKQNRGVDWIGYMSYGDEAVERGGWEWGSRDMMLDLGDEQQQQRMAILTAAVANLSGHLLLYKFELSQEEEKAFVEALSLAEGLSSLLIRRIKFRDFPALLSALKKNKRLKHLSLQRMEISDECVEVLRDFTSLTSLHLHTNPSSSANLPTISSEEDIVGRLAELHPSHSPLAASLHGLHIHSICIDWGRSTGFLRHWPHLKELSLEGYDDMTEEELMDFMDHLAPPKNVVETAGTLPSSPPQLYSLQLGNIEGEELSRSATAAVVDALSRSGLPFFEIVDTGSQEYQSRKNQPVIEAQLKRNQRNFLLRKDSTRVAATSMRLFICGDPFAGKSTLISTMRSIHSTRKRDKLIRPLFPIQGRTQGIEVGAIQKEEIRVSLWDMAGQSEFHAFHDCMFPDIRTSSYQLPSMFMFVWSPIDSKSREKGAVKNEKNLEASFRYWLRFLASKSRQSNIALKVIVVFTRADQMVSASTALSPLIDSLRSDFEGVVDILNPPFDVDARKKDSVKPVAERIFVIAKDMLQGIQVYNISTEIHKRLWKHWKNTNEGIITWEKFSEICYPFQFPNDNAKLKAIALCLNESGNIIYINGISHIILNPNWFCNEVMGSLINFSNSKASKSIIVFTNGCTPRDSLEKCLQSVAGSKVKGVLLVDLMDAMHLCCKVTSNHGVPNSNVDHIFIPALLTDGPGLRQLQWRSSTKLNVDDNIFVYIGRRLECEDKNRTFLTPGLFPRVQVLFNKAFQPLEEEYKATVMLGKDFISICFPNKEIIVVFCQAKSEHVIDVLVRANNPNNSQNHTSATLVDMELKCIINTLVTICAQPTGIQGVKLIESVIRPDSLHDPSKAQDREDQCVKLTYLKEQLRRKLLHGEAESYEWKWARQTPDPLQTNFIDLLGSDNYREVLMSCQAWLKKTTEYLYPESDEINVSREPQYQQNMTTKSLENSLLQHLEDQILEEATDVEVRSIKVMAKVISILYQKLDANHYEVLGKVDEMRRELHQEFQCLRKDVITNIEKSIGKLLRLAMENEAEKQLPQVAILTTIDDKNIKKFVTSMLGISLAEIHLYCEDPTLPHPVENQPGITLTSWLESHRDSLDKALPYINGFFLVLTKAIGLGIKSTGISIPDWTPHLKLSKGYSIISRIMKSEFDAKESFKEWQRCLASILAENGGVTDENIYKKFCLRRAIYDNKVDGGTQVAWLCKTHYEAQRPFPLN